LVRWRNRPIVMAAVADLGVVFLVVSRLLQRVA
jgi:hypothetical protein